MDFSIVPDDVLARMVSSLAWLEHRDIEFAQRASEFVIWCSAVQSFGKKSARPLTYLEIGSRNGGSLYCAAAFLPPESKVIAIDLPNGPWGHRESENRLRSVAQGIRAQSKQCHLILGDSNDDATRDELVAILAGQPLDAIFIDADHSFAGVSRDWERYGPLLADVALAGFHDIARRADTPLVEVYRLWSALSEKYPHLAAVHQYGVGILLLGQ